MKFQYLLIGTSLSLIPQTINAQCVATQDCATLGYTETSCSGGSGVKCPFGNKWACFKSDSEVCQQYGFTQTCTGTNQTSGVGKACNGKYSECTCASGYEWKNGSCQPLLNGVQGDLYYCNGRVVAVKATGMNFYVAMNNLGQMDWDSAENGCRRYYFCSNLKGTFPTINQLETIYNNKSSLNSLLSTNGGAELANTSYWSSSGDTGYHAYLNMYNGSIDRTNFRDTYFLVRPILTSW